MRGNDAELFLFARLPFSLSVSLFNQASTTGGMCVVVIDRKARRDKREIERKREITTELAGGDHDHGLEVEKW